MFLRQVMEYIGSERRRGKFPRQGVFAVQCSIKCSCTFCDNDVIMYFIDQTQTHHPGYHVINLFTKNPSIRWSSVHKKRWSVVIEVFRLGRRTLGTKKHFFSNQSQRHPSHLFQRERNLCLPLLRSSNYASIVYYYLGKK